MLVLLMTMLHIKCDLLESLFICVLLTALLSAPVMSQQHKYM
jgi:hypothetical protein